MTKDEFLQQIHQDPWNFPLAEIPPEWTAEAWEMEEVRNAQLTWLAQNISKKGKFWASEEFCDLLARALTTLQLVELYCVLRRCSGRDEEEWRGSFEAAFPSATSALPVPLAWQWEQASDPERMVEIMVESESPRPGWERKLRLFQVACCRRIWPLLEEAGRGAVEATERYADGQASADELEAARRRAAAAYQAARAARAPNTIATLAAAEAADAEVNPDAVADNSAAAVALERSGHDLYDERYDGNYERERRELARLMREIFGNPFRATYVEPSWLSWSDGQIARFAQEIYEQRTFGLLRDVARLLEEAGCAEGSILDHCRQAEEHVRGCWVLDLLLRQI